MKHIKNQFQVYLAKVGVILRIVSALSRALEIDIMEI